MFKQSRREIKNQKMIKIGLINSISSQLISIYESNSCENSMGKSYIITTSFTTLISKVLRLYSKQKDFQCVGIICLQYDVQTIK